MRLRIQFSPCRFATAFGRNRIRNQEGFESLLGEFSMQKTVLFIITVFFSAIMCGCANTPKSFGERSDVQQFIHQVSHQYHFKTQKLTKLFNHVHFKPKVIHKIKHPYEKTQHWYTYRQHFLNTDRINRGIVFWKKYHLTLYRASHIYRVPASMIVAIIGIESSYGKRTGSFLVLDSLSNIAFNYSARQPFFRSELTQYLLLCREKHLNPLHMYGSYAGAIGQPQFMPSSFRRFAVDFNKNGQIDLMHSDVDVIGSVANYFHIYGWKYNQPIIVPARIDAKKMKANQKGLNKFLITESKTKPTLSLSKLESLGVHPIHPLDKKQKVGLIRLETSPGHRTYWIGLHNFFVIKHYNRSPMYAMAAYELSKKIEQTYKKTP